MFTNDLKKGDKVVLRNGWHAIIMDNKKGNIRLAEVKGYCTEIGSVYAHDIVYLQDIESDVFAHIEHTPAQLKLRQTVGAL
jgi:hypothetical protein